MEAGTVASSALPYVAWASATFAEIPADRWEGVYASMQALKAQDRDAFVAAEMSERELAGLPPFGRLAAVIASGPDAAQLDSFMRGMAEVAPNTPGVSR